MEMAVMRTALLAGFTILSLTVIGCRSFERGVTWAPERIAYHINGGGEVDRVEQYDADDVCRRILFYRDDGGLKLIQDRDGAGVCRRATYYSHGRVTRIEEHDASGAPQDTTRFGTTGTPVTSK